MSKGLRIKKPLKKRYGMQHMKMRAAKIQDRATFRQRAEKAFAVVGSTLSMFDASLATVYMRGKRLSLAMLLWLVVLTAYVVWSR